MHGKCKEEKPTIFVCGLNNGNAVSHLALHFQNSITIEYQTKAQIFQTTYNTNANTNDGREQEMRKQREREMCDSVVEIEMKQNAMETNVDALF